MNPQILYNKLQNNEITKNDFVYFLRRDERLSESINNFMSFNDIVSVLKNKGLILEEENDSLQSIYDDIIEKLLDMPTSDAESRSMFIDNYLQLNSIVLSNGEKKELEAQVGDALKDIHGTPDDGDGLPDEDDEYSEGDYDYYLESADSTPKHKIIAQLLGPDFFLAKKPESKWDEKDHDLFNRVYKMASEEGKVLKLNEAKKKQKLKGGKGDKLTPDQVNPYEFKKGWKHELEHTDDIEKAKEIALDHLAEDPMYYSRLATMEKRAKTRTDVHVELDKKKSNVKDEGNAMQYYTKDKLKSNTSSDLGDKEKGNKKPKGVETMTMNAKSAYGIKKMPLPGKEKKIKSLTESIEEKIDYIDSIINEEMEVSAIKNNQYYKLSAGIGAIPARTIVRIEKDDFGDEYSITIFGEDGTTETIVVPSVSTLPLNDVKAPEDKMDEVETMKKTSKQLRTDKEYKEYLVAKKAEIDDQLRK
jgi:hypothetical protein